MTAAVGAASGADVYVDALPASALFADPAYQRDLEAKRVEVMVAGYDRRLVGMLEVSDRGSDRYAIIDGQHRHAAVLAAAGPDTRVVCQVHTGLSLVDEARLFGEVNTRRKPLSWWGQWKAARVAGDRFVHDVDEVLARHGLRVEPNAVDGNVRAVAALRVIVRDLGDLDLLDAALRVAVSSFGRSPDAFDGAVLQGIAYVLIAYSSSEVDVNRLVRALSQIPPRQIRARAASLREVNRGTLPRLAAAVIVQRYNAQPGPRADDFLARLPQLAKADKRSMALRAERRRSERVDAAPSASAGLTGPPATADQRADAAGDEADDDGVDEALPPDEVREQPQLQREQHQERGDRGQDGRLAAPSGSAAAVGHAQTIDRTKLTHTPSTTGVGLCTCGHAARMHERDDGDDSGRGACMASTSCSCTSYRGRWVS